MNARTEWTSEDVAQFRNFLKTQTGEKLIPFLQEQFPSLLGKGETNDILIRSGEVRGCQILMRELLGMAFPSEVKQIQSEAYPPLEDDSQWTDGQKLNPEQQPKVN